MRSDSKADKPDGPGINPDTGSGVTGNANPSPRAMERDAIPASLLTAIGSGLMGDPYTGVSILTADGFILYANEQAVRIFSGPDAPVTSVVGKYIRDLYPPQWVEQRLALFQQILATGKPVLLRTIWRGWQQYSWVQHIGSDPPEPDDDTAGESVPDRFLVITRRIHRDEENEQLIKNTYYRMVDSEVADLGQLEVLSTRELEVLALLGQGMSLKEAAATLHRSVKTIDNHRQAIGRKLNISDRVQLADIARRAGLTLADVDRPRV